MSSSDYHCDFPDRKEHLSPHTHSSCYSRQIYKENRNSNIDFKQNFKTRESNGEDFREIMQDLHLKTQGAASPEVGEMLAMLTRKFSKLLETLQSQEHHNTSLSSQTKSLQHQLEAS